MRASSTWFDGRRNGRRALVLSAVLMGCGDGEGSAAEARDAAPGAEIEVDASTSAAQAGDASLVKIDRSHLAAVGSAPLDYADPALWLCRPGNDPNECHEKLDTTELLKDGSLRVVPHVPAQAPAFDCFYSYLTVDISGGGNTTDFYHIDAILDALHGQAARFSRICEVYAPLYRQLSFNSSNELTGDPELAYHDVESALLYYLEHFNHGRRFVLIGHSQGTIILTRFLAERIDPNPALRAQMISAALIGGTLSAPEGQAVGGTFQNIPFCTAPAQTGCVIAYDSFAKDYPPNPNATMGFGHAPAGSVNGCTNPSLLAGNPGRYRGSYLPVTASSFLFVPGVPNSMLPAVTTPTILVRDLFKGECIQRDSLSYLEISPDQTADDQRPVPPYRYALQEQIGIGLHTGDFSIVMDDLIDTVEQQAKATP